MKRTIALLGALCAALAGHSPAAESPAQRPNILFILADDLGWSDLGCYGADLHETPNLDRFAREAVRFTQAYAMSVCSPTRATLMTGKHAARLHFTIWAEGAIQGGPKNRRLRQPECIANLPHSETTIAKHLQSAGYLTALVGKWHLGDWEHCPHYYHTTTPVSAIRVRDWKLLEYFEDQRVELYNLREHLGEQHDLAKEMPDRTTELRRRLHAWREAVGAALPKPNPDFQGGQPKPQRSQVTP